VGLLLREFRHPLRDYIEPTRYSPTPKHVRELIDLMQQRHVRVLLSPGYFDHNQIRQVAERTGARLSSSRRTSGALRCHTFWI